MRITIEQAINLLTSDKTAHKTTVYFAVGKSHQHKYNLTTIEVNGVRVKAVGIDAGKVTNVKQAVINLATESLLGGIYVCA